jgi:hypothetical protein
MSVLKTQFATAVALLEEKAALRDRVADWRRKAAAEGLSPSVLLKLAKESLQDEEERRKAAEQLEVEELYRKELGAAWVREYRKRLAQRSAALQTERFAALQTGEG